MYLYKDHAASISHFYSAAMLDIEPTSFDIGCHCGLPFNKYLQHMHLTKYVSMQCVCKIFCSKF